jgi:hypothetical protein
MPEERYYLSKKDHELFKRIAQDFLRRGKETTKPPRRPRKHTRHNPQQVVITARSRDGSNFRWRYTGRPLQWGGSYSWNSNTSAGFGGSASWDVYNTFEASPAGLVRTPLPLDTIVECIDFRHSIESGEDERAMMCNVPCPEAVAVTLAVDGGADGDASGPPTYTYTVTHAASGIQLGTTITPTMQRVDGKIVPAAIGLARTGTATVQLYWCDEVPEITQC